MEEDDYGDIEHFVVHWTAAAGSVGLMRPHFPSWRRQLRENGVDKVTIFDARAANLMTLFINNAKPGPKSVQERKAMHTHRNLIWAQGVPMLRQRGWKM